MTYEGFRFDPITKTCLYNFDPLKPHFYIVNLGFTGVYIIFRFSKFMTYEGFRFDPITKTCLYNFDPLKPHFYIVNLGFTGVYIIFLISAQNIDCCTRLTNTHNLCFEQKYEKYQKILSENFHFVVVKFSIYSNRHVFVMQTPYVISVIGQIGRANSVNPNERLQNAASDLIIHCLPLVL